MSRIFKTYYFYLILLSLIPSSLAAPSAFLPPIFEPLVSLTKNPLNLIPLLREAPPALQTKNPSPSCQNINSGTLLCCESIFDGGFPLVVKLSAATGYELTKDTINGVFCKRSVPGTCAKVELCCQVDGAATGVAEDVVNIALFCQHASRA